MEVSPAYTDADAWCVFDGHEATDDFKYLRALDTLGMKG